MYEIMPTFDLLNHGLLVNWMTKIVLYGGMSAVLTFQQDSPTLQVEWLPEF